MLAVVAYAGRASKCVVPRWHQDGLRRKVDATCSCVHICVLCSLLCSCVNFRYCFLILELFSIGIRVGLGFILVLVVGQGLIIVLFFVFVGWECLSDI